MNQNELIEQAISAVLKLKEDEQEDALIFAMYFLIDLLERRIENSGGDKNREIKINVDGWRSITVHSLENGKGD